MRSSLALGLTLALCACGDTDDGSSREKNTTGAATSSLEQAAIEAGVIPDVSNISLAGAFERQSELGEDRFCAVGNDEGGYQIGMLAVFGPDSKCEGMGEAVRDGETVRITLTSQKKCSFTAAFDGVELQISGNLPEACESYCTPRAIFDGVSFSFVGEGNSVARSTRGRDIDNLCPGG